jgi:hypothetical protein
MLDLRRNSFGSLLLVRDGVAQVVVPVRAFPISAPDEGLALVNAEGKEVAWIEHLSELPDPQQGLVSEELEQREFTPEISRIVAVSGYVTPCTWSVETDRGTASFVLKSEEAIRRLLPGSLLIADSQGIHFLVRDVAALDAASRRVLDRFL